MARREDLELRLFAFLIIRSLSSPPGIVLPLTSSSLEISNELDAYQKRNNMAEVYGVPVSDCGVAH